MTPLPNLSLIQVQSGFRLIPRGDIFLLRQINESLGSVYTVGGRRSSDSQLLTYNRTMFHAEIVGSPGRFFVVKYSGAGAQEVGKVSSDFFHVEI